MNRDNLEKKTNAEENSSAILLSPTGACASQDKRKNSVQPVGDFNLRGGRKMKKNGEVKEKVVKEKELMLIESLREPMALAEVFVKSGMFPDLKTACQGAVKIIAGREYGLTPIQSITELYMVNGRVAMSAKLIASAVRRSGKYDYHVDKMDNEECSISFFEVVNETKTKIGDSIFTIKDAAKAGIVNKAVWQSYPKQMLYARAISMGGRTFCPDIITAYTPEEVEDIAPIQVSGTVVIDEKGEVVSG